MPEERLQAIESLIEECGFATRKEFFDNAVSLLKLDCVCERAG
jgi:hypothetical protein